MLNPIAKRRQWSSHNRISTQDQPNGWIPIHPKYSDKLHKGNSDRIQLINKRKDTSKFYEPLSNLIELAPGDATKETARQVNVQMNGKLQLTTYNKKFRNLTPQNTEEQHNLQIGSDTKLQPPEELSVSSYDRNIIKNKQKIVVIGDSFAKGMASEIMHKLRNEFEVIGYVKPGASMKGINEGIKQVSTTLTKKDTVVIWGGANGIARNEANKALTNIKSVKFLNHTKVLLVNIPKRFDLTPASCVNEEITAFNRKLLKWAKMYEHVKLVDSKLQINYHY